MADRIRVKVLEHADSEPLAAIVGRCSAMSLYRRFHGVGDGVRSVGLGNRHAYVGTAEIGVLVEDGCQRRGVGMRSDLLADDHFVPRAVATVGLRRTWSADGAYKGLIDLGLGTAFVRTPSVSTPSEVLRVQSVYEAVGTATSPAGLEGPR